MCLRVRDFIVSLFFSGLGCFHCSYGNQSIVGTMPPQQTSPRHKSYAASFLARERADPVEPPPPPPPSPFPAPLHPGRRNSPGSSPKRLAFSSSKIAYRVRQRHGAQHLQAHHNMSTRAWLYCVNFGLNVPGMSSTQPCNAGGLGWAVAQQEQCNVFQRSMARQQLPSRSPMLAIHQQHGDGGPSLIAERSKARDGSGWAAS